MRTMALAALTSNCALILVPLRKAPNFELTELLSDQVLR